MIKLQTEVTLPENRVKLSYHQKSMMMGSCFTENIGIYLKELLFPMEVNPFGILYNPMSIANGLEILINENYFNEADLFYSNGLWNSFQHHGHFSNPDQRECLQKINDKIKEASATIKECNLLILTLGTSWVFEDVKSGRIVSNCHKLPSSNFRRYRLSPSEIIRRWSSILDDLWSVNPSVKVVFTVSPIRHLKDGLHENQLSKSTLLVAVDEIQKTFGQERILYFPSYEVLLDELRDYRFYSSDMVHLSETAIEIIREKFGAMFINPEEMKVALEVEKLVQSLRHRPFQQDGKGYQDFIDKQTAKINQMKSQYPYLDLDLILKQFELKKGIFNF